MPASLVAALVGWLLYFGLSAAIMLVDRRLADARARASGTVNYADQRLLSYLLFALFCGPLPLVMYFYGTRRNRQGALLGFGIATVHMLVVYGAATALFLVLVRGEAERACGGSPPPADGAACVRFAPQLGPQGLGAVERACHQGGLQACLALFAIRDTGVDPDADRADRAIQRAVALCRERAADPQCGGIDGLARPRATPP